MSKLTREDFYTIQRSKSSFGATIAIKALEQMELDRQKEEYFAKGGKIYGVSLAASGLKEPKEWGSTAEQIDEFMGTVGITEAAVICHVSKKSLDTHISRGKGPEFKLVRGRRRFTLENLKAWMAKRQVAA